MEPSPEHRRRSPRPPSPEAVERQAPHPTTTSFLLFSLPPLAASTTFAPTAESQWIANPSFSFDASSPNIPDTASLSLPIPLSRRRPPLRSTTWCLRKRTPTTRGGPEVRRRGRKKRRREKEWYDGAPVVRKAGIRAWAGSETKARSYRNLGKMKYFEGQVLLIRCLGDVLIMEKFGWPLLNFRTKLLVLSHRRLLVVCKPPKGKLAYWRRLWSLIQIMRNCCFSFRSRVARGTALRISWLNWSIYLPSTQIVVSFYVKEWDRFILVMIHQDNDQLSRVFLFEDVTEFLCSLSSEEARFSLICQPVDFYMVEKFQGLAQWLKSPH